MVLLLAIPILIQVYFNSSLTYLLMRLFRVRHSVAMPGALMTCRMSKVMWNARKRCLSIPPCSASAANSNVGADGGGVRG